LGGESRRGFAERRGLPCRIEARRAAGHALTAKTRAEDGIAPVGYRHPPPSTSILVSYSARAAAFEGSAASAFSIAPVNCGESGVVLLAKRAITLPLRSTRNLAKF